MLPHHTDLMRQYIDFDITLTNCMCNAVSNEIKEREGARTMFDNCTNAKLTKLKLHGDPERGYHLSATYEYETDEGVFRATFPHIVLDVMTKRLPWFKIEKDPIYIDGERGLIDIGFRQTIMDKHDNHDGTDPYYFKVETLQEKTHKMTIAEIEKKLGYKIEIVSEK